MYTVKEVAEMFGLSIWTVYEKIATGEIQAIDIGRANGKKPNYRIEAKAIDEYKRIRTVYPRVPIDSPNVINIKNRTKQEQPKTTAEWKAFLRA